MYYVYLLRCNDDTLYCGYTNDLYKRLEKHNSKKGAKYTRIRVPCKLEYFETFCDKSDALKREFAIKKLSRRQKEILINNFYE